MGEAAQFNMWEKLRELSIDEETKKQAEHLFFKIREQEGEISESKALILMRCCTLICSHNTRMQTVEGQEISGNQISISNFLKGTPADLSTYVAYFEKLLQCIPQSTSAIIQELIRKIEISTILYKKFRDIWEKVGLQGNESYVSTMMQLIWLIVINLKCLLKLSSVLECGYLMIGVYSTALKNLDKDSMSLSENIIADLSSILKANADQAKTWAVNIESLISDYLQKGSLCSKNSQVSGVFSGSVAHKNVSLLSSQYQSYMTQDDLDERDLILLRQKIRTPQKPRCMRVSKPHEIVGKVLRWDEATIGPSISSKLHEVSLPPPSPFIPPPTPMTMAMELNNWFTDLLEIKEPAFALLSTLIPEYAFKIMKLRIQDMLEAIKKVFVQRNIGTKSNLGMIFLSENFEVQSLSTPAISNCNSRIEELSQLIEIVIGRVMKKEADKQNNIESLALNEEFQRGIVACCLEALLYLHSVVSINFEEVLEICGTAPFDFWRVINAFSSFDANIPQSLRRHYREIEIKIISNLAWKEGSKINLAIKRLIAAAEESADTNLFLRRLLSHCANRILELSNSLGLSEAVKEEIWTTFKYLLSEKTEILVNRHVDHMIICTIYGVCKIHASITFKQLVEKYRQLYLEEPNFFKKVYIDEETSEDIIMFYNLVYIGAVKEFLMNKITTNKPRIDILHPASPLRASVPSQMISSTIISSLIKSPMKSPFRTPRSEILWAPNEAISPMPKLSTVNKKISFEPGLPTKKPKIIGDILNISDGEIGPAPTLKRDGSTN